MEIQQIQGTETLNVSPNGAHLTIDGSVLSVPEMTVNAFGMTVKLSPGQHTLTEEHRYVALCKRRGSENLVLMVVADPDVTREHGYDYYVALAHRETFESAWSVLKIVR